MRDQVELCFFIGYAGKMQADFESACIDAATRLCGGCFVAEGTGYWREGDERRTDSFDGALQAERTLCLKLTTELHKERQVISAMRRAIATSVSRHGMRSAVRWVHVQRHLIIGLHFNIDNALAEAA